MTSFGPRPSRAIGCGLVIALVGCGGARAVSGEPETLETRGGTAMAESATGNAGANSNGAPSPSVSASASASATATSNEPPKQIGARHVLIQWMGTERAADSVVRTRDQAHALAEEVLRRAKGGEDLGRLASEFSDEPGAGGRGGLLGRFPRGQMVPAFESAAFQLKVGEISGIIESPFGYHIIQRTE